MTDLAFMAQSDWAREGAMEVNGSHIRKWLGGTPIFAGAEVPTLSHREQLIADSIEPDRSQRRSFRIIDLNGVRERIDLAIAILNPIEDSELEAIRRAFAEGLVERAFVMLWSAEGMARNLVDAFAGVDLYTDEQAKRLDPVVIEAAREMVRCEYNGLKSGRGKDVVVQLVRAFTAAGHGVTGDEWVRAYLSAGGATRHAATVATLAKEIDAGRQHRVKAAFRPNIVEILTERTVT